MDTSTGLTGETLAGKTFISSSSFFSSPNKVLSISDNSSGKNGAGSAGLATSTGLTGEISAGKTFISSSFFMSSMTSGLGVVIPKTLSSPNKEPSISDSSSGKDGLGSTGFVTSRGLTVVTLVGKMFFSSSFSISSTTSGLVVLVVVVFVVPNRLWTTSGSTSSKSSS